METSTFIFEISLEMNWRKISQRLIFTRWRTYFHLYFMSFSIHSDSVCLKLFPTRPSWTVSLSFWIEIQSCFMITIQQMYNDWLAVTWLGLVSSLPHPYTPQSNWTLYAGSVVIQVFKDLPTSIYDSSIYSKHSIHDSIASLQSVKWNLPSTARTSGPEYS